MRNVLREGALEFLMAVPEAPAAGPLPVLCFLHGYDEGAPAPIQDGVTRHGPLRTANVVRPSDTFIVIAPQLPTRGDLWHRYAGDVGTILERIVIECRGDPDRAYLTGFSFGGNGVFDLAILQPDTWAALWAVDPTRPPARDPGRPAWVSVGEAARPRMSAFVRILALQTAGDCLEGDRLHLDRGSDHVGSATEAYDDSRIYAWLLTKRLR